MLQIFVNIDNLWSINVPPEEKLKLIFWAEYQDSKTVIIAGQNCYYGFIRDQNGKFQYTYVPNPEPIRIETVFETTGCVFDCGKDELIGLVKSQSSKAQLSFIRCLKFLEERNTVLKWFDKRYNEIGFKSGTDHVIHGGLVYHTYLDEWSCHS